MTNLDLWLTLTQAEATAREYAGTAYPWVAAAAQDTVDLCHRRMDALGMTRGDLQKAARREAAGTVNT